MEQAKKIRPGRSAGAYILPGYDRFDQKNNMMCASGWNPRYAGTGPAEIRGAAARRMRERQLGFGPRDFAFLKAAGTNLAAAGVEINTSDAGGISWNAIPRAPGSVETRDGDDFPAYEGTRCENTNMLKKMARVFGATDSGVCRLDRRFVYKSYFSAATGQSCPIRFSDETGLEHITAPATLPDGTKVIPASMQYALVLVFPMEYRGVMTAPTMTHMATTAVSYSQISYTVMALAEFIRALGYYAIPSINDTAISIPMAIDAGLGEPTRNAKLAHPVYGTNCRIAKIITSLPLEEDTPIAFGAYERCRTCKRCAKSCPAGAISMGDDMADGGLGDYSHMRVRQWPVNHAKCKAFWAEMGTNCGICVARCTLNRPKAVSADEFWTQGTACPDESCGNG